MATSGLICFANAAAAALFGRPQAELVGQSMPQLLQPGAAGRRKRESQAQTRAAAPRDALPAAVGTLLCADGVLRTVQMAVAPLRANGRRFQIVLLHDLTDRVRTHGQLLRSQARLARLSSALDTAQQDERRRVGHALHDETQQALAAIRMNLEAVGQAIAPTLPEMAALLGRTSEIALAAMASTSEIIDELGPPMLDELGLGPALESLARRFTRQGGARCDFQALGLDTPEAAPPARPVARCLYRVAEEVLANVARHSRATRVQMVVVGDTGGGVTLHISDDGVGMRPEDREDPAGTGLPVLRERLRAIGGSFEVRSTPGNGTTIIASVASATAGSTGRAGVVVDGADTGAGHDEAHAALLRFLYRAPVGLVEARLDGRIELLNPLAARWLLPLSPDGELENLFDILAHVAPQLREQAAAVDLPAGVICEALCVAQTDGDEQGVSRPVTLTLVRQDSARLMAVLGDGPSA